MNKFAPGCRVRTNAAHYKRLGKDHHGYVEEERGDQVYKVVIDERGNYRLIHETWLELDEPPFALLPAWHRINRKLAL